VASPSPEQEANAPPELGWVPDFGYVSATIADFNGDGEMEIGWGARCHYYLLNSRGQVLWQVPTAEGYGVYVTHKADGSIEADTHGTGGLSGYASATGNLDGDSDLEIAVSLGSEFHADYYESNGTVVYDKVTRANMVWVLDGKDGTVQWKFEGEYPSENGIEAMYEPILVDLTGDGLLDVLVLSQDNHLYAIDGATGARLLAYPVPLPLFWYAVRLAFVGDGDKGIVLYPTLKGDSTYTTNALQIAQRVSTTP
jgi:outer membrane protein assembly factor BamB